MSFQDERQQKARMLHRCGECHGDIIKGEVYHVLVGVHEGDFYHEKQCMDCHPVYMKINDAHWKDTHEGIPFGSMYECLSNEELKVYIATKIKRGRTPQDWMLNKIKNV